MGLTGFGKTQPISFTMSPLIRPACVLMNATMLGTSQETPSLLPDAQVATDGTRIDNPEFRGKKPRPEWLEQFAREM